MLRPASIHAASVPPRARRRKRPGVARTADAVQLAVITALSALAAFPLVQGVRLPISVDVFGSRSRVWLPGPTVLELALPPVVFAAGAVGCVQIVAALAGRGRAAPGSGLIPYLRPALIAVGAVAEIAWIDLVAREYNWELSRAGEVRLLAGALLGTFALGGAAIAVGRASGGSIVVPTLLVAAAVRTATGWSENWPQWIVIVGLGCGPVLLAIAATGLDAQGLGRLGITPWAPADLALAPVVLALGLVIATEHAVGRGAVEDAISGAAHTLHRHPWIGLPPGLAVAAMLLLIRRRLASSDRMAVGGITA